LIDYLLTRLYISGCVAT